MSRSTVIIIMALFVILVPFLGFPRGWEPYIFLLLGGVIITIELYAVLVRAQRTFFRNYEINTEVYAERIQRKATPTLLDSEDEEKEGPLNDEKLEEEVK